MKNLAQKIDDTQAIDLIHQNYFLLGNRIDWRYVKNHKTFDNISDILIFLDGLDFDEIYYINDAGTNNDYLLSKENLSEFIDFIFEKLPPYHYFIEKHGDFVIFMYDKYNIYYGEYNFIKKIIQALEQKIENLNHQLKSIKDNQEKERLISEKMALKQSIFQIKFCHEYEIFANTIHQTTILDDSLNKVPFSHFRVLCDNDTDDIHHWHKINDLLLSHGDLIIQKK